MGGDERGNGRVTAARPMNGRTHATNGRLSDALLARILDMHRSWVGSGWEIGQRAALTHADLHGRDLSGVLLNGADLHRSDLHNAMLDHAELDGADLHRADLHRADLRGADLEYADLHEADLHGADLSGALLRAADLHRADLHDAILAGADLTDADLRGADLRWVRGLSSEQTRLALIDDATRLSENADATPSTVASES